MSKKVIMVDDSKSVLATVEMVVAEMAEEGVIAFKPYLDPVELYRELAAGSSYDLLIVDINMPGMNGFELVERVKALEHLKGRPIFFITTERSPEMKQKGRSLGAVGWLTKPVSNEKLLKVINFALGL